MTAGQAIGAAGSAPAGMGAKIWVTREHVQIDRIASAWLIRRFIDASARFKFVPGRSYAPRSGEVRFDMFEGEYTHEGDRCTFEVLLQRYGLTDRALVAIGEIVHDIDLKDGKFGHAETRGIAALINGLTKAGLPDAKRIEQGRTLFDNLYASFCGRRG